MRVAASRRCRHRSRRPGGARRLCAGAAVCGRPGLCIKSGTEVQRGRSRVSPGWPAGRSASSTVAGTLGPCQTTGAERRAMRSLRHRGVRRGIHVLRGAAARLDADLPDAAVGGPTARELPGPRWGRGRSGRWGTRKRWSTACSENNDFGNSTPSSARRIPMLSAPSRSGRVASTVQAAYDGASDNDVICLFSRHDGERCPRRLEVADDHAVHRGARHGRRQSGCRCGPSRAAASSRSSALTPRMASIGWLVPRGGHEIEGRAGQRAPARSGSRSPGTTTT